MARIAADVFEPVTQIDKSVTDSWGLATEIPNKYAIFNII